MASRLATDFWLPCRPARAFAFFADVRHLDRLTPGWFRFRIHSPQPIEMALGTRIDYLLRWRGLRLRWRSRITVWQPHRSFEYEQARGPFRSFRHDHRFLPESGGVRVVDRIHFAGPACRVLDRSVVAADLRRILAHRAAAAGRLLAAGERETPAGELQDPAPAAGEAARAAPSRSPRTSASSSAIDEPT